MNEEVAFVAALVADPSDKTTALVFADWLDERNDPRGPMLRDDDTRAWMAPTYEYPYPRLRKALETGKGVMQANVVLARIGEAAVPEVVPLLTHATPIVRLRTVKALRRMAGKARPAVPALLEFVKGTDRADASARFEAARLLGVLRAKKGAADELAKGLDSDAPADRLAAIEAMAKLNTTAAAGALCKALADPDDKVRWAAAYNLYYIATPAMTFAVDPLRRALTDTVQGVRNYSFSALEKIGPKAAAALPDVLLFVTARAAKDRGQLYHALGVLGAGTPEALALVLDGLRHAESQHWAMTALVGWPAALPAAGAPALLDFFRTPPADPTQAAHRVRCGLQVLAKIAPPPREVLDEVRKGLRGDHATEAAKVVSGMGPAAAPLLPDLVALLHRGAGKGRDQYEIAKAIGKIGGIAALAEALESDDDVVSIAAASGLRDAGDAARPALPELLAQLDKFRGTNWPRGLGFLTGTLVAIGPDAAAAVPPLVEMFLSPNCPAHYVRCLCEALIGFGPALLPFAPHLVAALGDQTRHRDHERVIEVFAGLSRNGYDTFPVLHDTLKRVTAEQAAGSKRSWESYFRDLAAAAVVGLGEIGPSAEAAVPAIALAEQTFDTYRMSEKAIAAYGAIGGAAVPHIRAAMAHKTSDIRVAAIKALGATADVSDESQQALRKLEADANKTVRRLATSALQKLGTRKWKRK